MASDELTLLERVIPIVGTLRRYDRANARLDFVGGLTVALFTIPQGMAYALIAGLPPATGIYAAVMAVTLGAAFGSSELLMNGPTNAISAMLAANAALFASQGDPARVVVVLTLFIGISQLAASLLRLGSFSRFVSEPVLTGFTAGAGLYIVVNQLPVLLGLDRSTMARDILGWTPPANCVFDVIRAILSLGAANGVAVAVGLSTFILVRLLQWLERRWHRRIPAPFLAVVAISAASYALGLGDPGRGVEKLKLVRDIEPLTRALPALAWPSFAWSDVQALSGAAAAIGLLGAVEAIAIGKVLASRMGHPFDANRQLVGEGMCNLGAALVGGFASSGSFTRSAVNFESGARTRLSCIFCGALMLAILLLFAPAANHIPVAALAGTLIHIGLKLVNVGQLRLTLQTTVADRIVLLVTFVGVLSVAHLQYALFAGIAVSIYFALRRAEGVKLVRLVEHADGHLIEEPLAGASHGEVVALDLHGELFFAAAEEIEQRLRELVSQGSRFIVLRLTHAYNMDATSAEALSKIARLLESAGGKLVLSGVRAGMLGTLERAGLVDQLGRDAVFAHEAEVLRATQRALGYAHSLADRAAATRS